jgi:Ca2+/Na+ antiporter
MTSTMAVLLQNDGSNAVGALFGGVMMLVWLAIVVVVIIGGWKMFEKASQPGWAILIPFYNIYILLKIAGRPGWWLILCIIPLVNIVIGIIVAIDIAKSFGQSAVFGFFLLFLLGGIGYLILGFGNYRYQGAPAHP